nr:hypothetical protein [Methanococcoides sp. AM1]
MTLRLNYLYGNSVEVFLDTLQQEAEINVREIVKYKPYASKNTKSFPRYIEAPAYRFTSKILSDLQVMKRKLKYLQSLDDNVLFCLGSENEALYGNIASLPVTRNKPSSMDMVITVNGKFSVGGGEVYEAEVCTDVGSVTDVSDSNASAGMAASFSAQNAGIKFALTQADYRLPAGTYDIFARIRDSNQVASDIELEVYNETDSTSLVSSKKTVTSSYDLYTASFTVDSGDADDTIRFGVFKDTVTTNTIYVDFLGFARTA